MPRRRILSLTIGVALFVVAFAQGCSSSSSSGPAPAANCVSRCTSYATGCKEDTAQCSNVCASITEAALSCLEQAKCDSGEEAKCLPVGGGAGAGGSSGAAGAGGSSAGDGGATASGGSMSSGTGGQTMCLAKGEKTCSNSAEGPNCCSPQTCDAKMGCCVQDPNAPCLTDDDCCGGSLGTVHCISAGVCVVKE